MRGGSQSHLVQARDGCYYVAKFAGNPQGTRTLINEWIAGNLLRTLGIRTPELRILQLAESCRTDDLFFQVGNRRKPVRGALHLGSRCPVNPETTAIFDMLAARLLPRVSNISDFGRVFVVDCWLGQADTRQTIYTRNRRSGSISLWAWMIDHGQGFGGETWDVKAMSLGCRCFQLDVYNLIDMPAVIEETIAAIRALPDGILYQKADTTPGEWRAPRDQDELPKVLDAVNNRRRHLDSIATLCWSGIEQRHRCAVIPPTSNATTNAAF